MSNDSSRGAHEVVATTLDLVARTRRLFPRGGGPVDANGLQVLAALALTPDAGPKEVAERLGTTPSTVSQALARLRDEGLIKERFESARQRRTTLTAKGRKVLDQSIAHWSRVLEQ